MNAPSSRDEALSSRQYTTTRCSYLPSLHAVGKTAVHLVTARFFPSDLLTEPQFLAGHIAIHNKEYISQLSLVSKMTIRQVFWTTEI